jgi:hypothetical protein
MMDRAESLARARDLAARCYQEQGIHLSALEQAHQDLSHSVSPAPIRALARSLLNHQKQLNREQRFWKRLGVGLSVSGLVFMGLMVWLWMPPVLDHVTPPSPVTEGPLPVVGVSHGFTSEDEPLLYHALWVVGADQVKAGWVHPQELLLEVPTARRFYPLVPIIKKISDGAEDTFVVPMPAPGQNEIPAQMDGRLILLGVATPTTPGQSLPAQPVCQLSIDGQSITVLNAPNVQVLDAQGHTLTVPCPSPASSPVTDISS